MDENEIISLKEALEEERKARKLAESKLEKLEKKTLKLKADKKALKERVLQKKSELKGVFENINDAFVHIDLNGNVIKMNDVANTVFGYEFDKNNPLNLMKLVHPADYKYTLEAFQKLVKDGFYSKYRSRIITKDQTVKMLEVNCSLVYDKEGEVIGAQGIARDITQEIEVQELMGEQKKQLDIIFNNSPIGIALSQEKDEDFLLVNKALTEMLGYTFEELKKLKVDQFTHPDDRFRSKELRDRLSSGKLERFDLEKRYIRKNGEVLWAKTVVQAVRSKDGKVKFQVAIVEDITENKLAKEQLIESQNRLSSLVSNLDSGVLLEDEKREISITNKKFCDIFSLDISHEELIGKNCLKLLDESKSYFENPEKIITRINKLVKDKKVVLGDELRLIDGRILERDYIPIAQNKEYKGHLWTYRDVTLSRNYRKSLEAHKKRYSNIIANLKLGLVELDSHNKVLSANKSFMKMTGYDEDEITGKDIRILFRKEKIKDLIQKRNIERKQGKSGSYEFKFINHTNEEKVILVSAAPNFDIGGEIIGSIGIILDITDIKKLESQKEKLLKTLERRNTELEEYAHIVSHDLKSPLRSISALTSWLKEDHGEALGGDGIRNVDLIQEVVEKMERLINDILNYSSINNNTASNEEVNTLEVVKEIKKILYVPKHIKINISNKLPVIKADKIRIQQLFQNLMGNAVNYIDKEKGIINIDCKEKKHSRIFSIQDNGVGIPKEYHKKIFEVFESLGDHKDSTGIGLSIVKKIVDVYDGKIWLESEEGKGTTFFIEFKK
ncbi:PAS domain S-box protein [Tenacibaculum amylolyticum]|uniref:PAS domain S-box protein n=1 Tax=Tenacibaculum amylolyticum TaxID=104269 RepID=UPI003892D076